MNNAGVTTRGETPNSTKDLIKGNIYTRWDIMDVEHVVYHHDKAQTLEFLQKLLKSYTNTSVRVPSPTTF